MIFSGCSDKNQDNGQTGTVTLKTLSGGEMNVNFSEGRIKKFKDLNISGYENKILFLDFFSTSCGPCRDEIPHLVNLQNKYKEDFAVIGILVENKTLEEIRDFATLFNINYPVTDAGEEYIMTELVGGVRGIPAMFMFDKNGEYFTHYIGAVPQTMIENDIKKILAK
jgi:thiol-disulfide isomerase/thioredoxin